MNAVEDWNADMDAWALDSTQRLHYLRRLRDHNAQVLSRLEASRRRWDVAQAVLASALVACIIVAIMLSLGAR